MVTRHGERGGDIRDVDHGDELEFDLEWHGTVGVMLLIRRGKKLSGRR